MKRCALLFLACAAADATALEARISSGLQVSSEVVREAVVIDGVPVRMERFTGDGVLELARRIEAKWAAEGSKIQGQQQGPWTLRSRQDGNAFEVIQWREPTSGLELLWSRIEAGVSLQPAPAALLQLPAGCSWGRAIWGASAERRYFQQSARCNRKREELSSLLHSQLSKTGWHVHAHGLQGLMVSRQGVEGLIGLEYVPGDAATWLVWLRVEAL